MIGGSMFRFLQVYLFGERISKKANKTFMV